MSRVQRGLSENSEIVWSRTSGFTGKKFLVGYDPCALYCLNTWLYYHVLDCVSDLGRLTPGDVSVALITNKPSRDTAVALLPFLNATMWRRFPLRDTSAMLDLFQLDPPILYAKPSCLRVLLDSYPESYQLRPAVILCGGEQLYDDDRMRLQAVFKAPVIDAFATTECGPVAASLPNSKLLQVLSSRVIVEVVSSNGEINTSGEGELLVTSVFNWYNPFIRYWTGDCGRVHLLADGTQQIEGLRRRAEAGDVHINHEQRRQLERYLCDLDVWDYRLTITGDVAFILWASAQNATDLDREIERSVLRALTVERCHVRRVRQVAKPGGKRLRYPIRAPEPPFSKAQLDRQIGAPRN
jgi:hypothetical protein